MRTKKPLIIAAVAVMSLTLMGCHGYNHRNSGAVGYGYGWQSDSFYYPSYSRQSRHSHHSRHNRHRHNRNR